MSVAQSIDELENTDTLKEGSVKGKQFQPTVEDDMIDGNTVIGEKSYSPSLVKPTKEIQLEPVAAKPPSIGVVKSVEDKKEKDKKEDGDVATVESNLDIISLPLWEQKSGILPAWFKNMFRKRDKFLHDWESPILEAFIIGKNQEKPQKLPFGHQRLTFCLKQVIKKDIYLSWDEYLALDSQHHKAIEQIVTHATELDSRERTFLALTKKSGPEGDRLLVFFSLNGLGAAARMMGSMGQKRSFPFGRDRTWEVSFTMIISAACYDF
jgi:hypothetical protein